MLHGFLDERLEMIQKCIWYKYLRTYVSVCVVHSERPLSLSTAEEVSLSKSFDLFDVLDVRVHNKFFRSIGVNDNAIKLAESHNASDKVYELLRVWMQREGLRANINHLLQALLDLDQRYSAEQIASRSVERGYYKYEWLLKEERGKKKKSIVTNL